MISGNEHINRADEGSRILPVFYWLFTLVTLAQMIFTGTYYLIKQQFDLVMVVGLILYFLAISAGLIAARFVLYQKKRHQLLEELLS